MKTKHLIVMAVAAALLLPTLGACGKKADLDPPPDAPKARTYPKPN